MTKPTLPYAHQEKPAASWFARYQLVKVMGPLMGLIVIVLGFGLAVQIKNTSETRTRMLERADRLAKAGKVADPVPPWSSLFWKQDNPYLSINSFRATANQTATVGIAAMGMTLIIISAGIDLSVGSVIALACVVTALFLREGADPIPAALAGVATGGLCGLLNAGMITQLRVVPFIATLGMWGMARGLAKGLADEMTINTDAYWLGDWVLVRTPDPPWLLVSPGVWVMFLLAVGMACMLRYTVLGRHIFAIGSNEATARLCGIKVNRVKFYLYGIAGLTTGLAGVMQFCRLTVGDPSTAQGAELDVIAAVVIGGGSLNGGEGSVFGTLIGAFIMAFLRVGCVHVGIPSWVQEIVIGAVIVLAVALDALRRRSRT